MIGPSVRHGPHHGAQRSTTTGTDFDRSTTSVSNVASVTSVYAMPFTLRTSGGFAAPLPGAKPLRCTLGRVIAAPQGIDVDVVTGWLADNVIGAQPPFTFDLIAPGHSNLTFRVTGADGSLFVLRRPPLGHVLASAHDMGREFRVISGLQDTAVPVPPSLGYCDDPAVNGVPFYVMGFVDGYVIRDRSLAEAALSPAARANASRSLIDTMAAIHAVDVEAAGLSDLGRHEGYIARQLKRWYGQFEQQKTRELPLVKQVHDALAARIPEQGPAT